LIRRFCGVNWCLEVEDDRMKDGGNEVGKRRPLREGGGCRSNKGRRVKVVCSRFEVCFDGN
jgi:hypothetical protein